MSGPRRLRRLADLSPRGRRVFLRADLNVPLDGGRILDDTRIRASLPTLEHLRKAGARVLLASHLGRPKGERRPGLSLAPVADALGLPLAPDCIGPGTVAAVADLAEGEALLLENLRFHAGETDNAPEFVDALAQITDLYVNDAFGTAHRAHASTVGLAERCPERGAGLLLQREVDALSRVRDEPARPYVCILGGAKVSDKLGVLEALAARADVLVIGGAMAYTFLLARGEPIGRSLVEPERIGEARRVLAGRATVLLPTDHVVASDPDAPAGEVVRRIPDDRMALDIGPETCAEIERRIEPAATVFWNGPLGLFEREPFADGTRRIAQTVARARAFSVVGGGDSVAAVHLAGVADRIDHISTGGGAALEYVEGRTLPGIAVLEVGE